MKLDIVNLAYCFMPLPMLATPIWIGMHYTLQSEIVFFLGAVYGFCIIAWLKWFFSTMPGLRVDIK